MTIITSSLSLRTPRGRPPPERIAQEFGLRFPPLEQPAEA
jgi:hypothetical protein